MATALFRCRNSDIVLRLSGYIKDNLPCQTCETWPFDEILGISFRGICRDAYYFCMNLVPQWPGDITFLGIDETSNTPVDQYKIATLDKYGEKKAKLFDTYFSILRRDFVRAVFKSYFSYEEALTIVERCALSYLDRDEWQYLQDLSRWFHAVTMLDSSVDLYEAIDKYITPSYGSPMFNFAVRCMVHFCYLRLRKFKMN